MTVPNAVLSNRYVGTGTVATYAYSFRALAAADLLVQIQGSGAIVTTLVLGTDYTVDGVGQYNGGTVTLTAGNLTAGYVLLIFRNPAQLQNTSLQTQGAYSAASVETALDQLTMIAQALQAQVNTCIRGALTDTALLQLPAAGRRASQFLAFDASGLPIATSGTAGGVPIETVTQIVSTIAALKSLAAPVTAVTYVVQGYYALGDSGGGLFAWNATDTTADNGGTVIQPNGGGIGRWNRLMASVFNVRWFGAYGDGVHDDTAAIRAAGVALQAAGSGSLFFPRGTYQLYSDGSSATLASFTGLTGVAVVGDGATLNVNRTFSAAQTIQYVFHFTTCIDVTIDGLRLTSPEETGSNKTTRGTYWCWFENGCSHIRVPNLDVVGGVMVMGFFKLVSDADTMKCRDIHIGTVHTKSVGYPINLQFSGDDMVVDNLNTNLPYRSFLIYGVKNIRAKITSKDPTASDTVVTAFGGKGCEDVEIDYHNTDTTASSQSTTDCAVAIRFSDLTPAIMRNIRVKVNLVYPASGWFGNGVQIDKYSTAGTPDPTDRGHTLQNVVITGKAIGPSISPGGLALFTVGTWGTGEFVDQIAVRDFYSIGLGSSNVALTSLTGRAVLDNYFSDGHCYCSVSTAGRLVITNSKALNFFPSTGDTSRIDFIGCEITSAAALARTNKTFIETVIAGRRVSHLVPSASLGDSVLRSATTKSGDLTTALNCFRVLNASSGGLFRVKIYAVKNSADFSSGSRIESVSVQTFTATMDGSGTWGVDLANAAEVTQRDLNGGGTVTVSRVNGDATGGIVAVAVSGFNNANGFLAVELELFTTSNVATITPM